MKNLLMMAVLGLIACSNEQSNVALNVDDSTQATGPAYAVIDESLQELKDDFNAAAGKVRLLFISGPSCGICLRGMADLNDEFLAAAQDDDRLQTFVVHVPTLGAKEKHAADSIPLLQGLNIHHYWEESGIIGVLYRDAMDVPMYVWDFWAIYGPDALWEGEFPPLPDYFEHQLGVTSGRSSGFTREQVLDPPRFAAETAKYLQRLSEQPRHIQASAPGSTAELLADGTVIPFVSQPRGIAIGQHIRGRGGYQNLKRIQSIEKRGNISVNDESLPLKIDMVRSTGIQRVIGTEPELWAAQSSEHGLGSNDSFGLHGLPEDLDRLLLASFDFDGPLVEWPDKGHKAKMQGMEKIGEVLAWQLDFVHKSGEHWKLFINSHGGGIVKAHLLDENERVKYTILQSDYQQISGFTFPHRIEYLDTEGVVLAVEEFDEIVVVADNAEAAAEHVSH